MAQPNVAREPSMDEILASIRKIIENNEAMPDLAADAADDRGFDITTESEGRPLLDHPGVIEQGHAEEHASAAVQPQVKAGSRRWWLASAGEQDVGDTLRLYAMPRRCSMPLSRVTFVFGQDELG